MTNDISGSEYVNQERRDYSLYVLQQRAIPHAADGLKAAARRVLWTARDGKKHKSATLAGATMPIHPHQSPEGAVNTLAAPYGNNIPLLDGDGAFGTLLNPTAYGAARYTSVKASLFCKDVMFRDLEIVPMQENYDGTLMEPKHFLPLIPMTLLNPQEGIAVGFASNILPRSLEQIIKSQIAFLEGNDWYEEPPTFKPLNQSALDWESDDDGNIYKYFFEGSFERVDTSTVKITNLPYGVLHEKYINHLLKLEDEDEIQDFEDNSKDHYNIDVKFKRGVLSRMEDEDIVSLLKLRSSVNENLTIIDYTGERVAKTSYGQFIEDFCNWRLEWYVNRYQRLADNIKVEIQRYRDILTAIKNNVGGKARSIQSRTELKQLLDGMGIVYVDYIADLPIYRFTEDEKKKVEDKLAAAEKQLKEYEALLKSPKKRRNVYISELQEILSKKGSYYARS